MSETLPPLRLEGLPALMASVGNLAHAIADGALLALHAAAFEAPESTFPRYPVGSAIWISDHYWPGVVVSSVNRRIDVVLRDVDGTTSTLTYDLDSADRGYLRPCPFARHRWPNHPVTHSAYAGDLCTEGADGCCTVCSVEMTLCPACNGIGYHRDGCEKPDWVVLTVRDRGRGEFFRWSVSGLNLNFPEGHPSHKFYWSVTDLDSDRYDVSRAVLVTE